jgi:hypothetical protein
VEHVAGPALENDVTQAPNTGDLSACAGVRGQARHNLKALQVREKGSRPPHVALSVEGSTAVSSHILSEVPTLGSLQLIKAQMHVRIQQSLQRWLQQA